MKKKFASKDKNAEWKYFNQLCGAINAGESKKSTHFTVKKINLIQTGYLEFRTNLRFFRIIILVFSFFTVFLRPCFWNMCKVGSFRPCSSRKILTLFSLSFFSILHLPTTVSYNCDFIGLYPTFLFPFDPIIFILPSFAFLFTVCFSV